MINNEWLENEMRALRSERIKKKPGTIFVLAMILMSAFTAVVAYDTPRTVCHYKRWSSTWKCKSCGYENYDEISNCGVCGSAKPKK